MEEILIRTNHLVKYYKTPRGTLHAVDDVNISIRNGKTLGLVGESGCGKSTTGRTILRLIEPTSGDTYFDGVNINNIGNRELRRLRSKMQIVFQDPFSSLNPRKTVSDIIGEPLFIQNIEKDKRKIQLAVANIMERVGLNERYMETYPHELDGGRRQRIGIARALIMNPKFIVCDEPVSSLDVSIQAQILNLMKSIQDEMGLTYLFITHDLSVVNHFSDEVAVMYLGKIVEQAPTSLLFENPMHPYTQALLSAIPKPKLEKRRDRIILKGELSSPINPEPVCRFFTRCIHAKAGVCDQGVPQLLERAPKHYVACERVGEIN